MKDVNVISHFLVRSNGRTSQVQVEGAGQATVEAVRKDSDPRASIVLQGFSIDGKYQEANLESHWDRTILPKRKK